MSSDADSKLFRDTVGPVKPLSIHRTRPRSGIVGDSLAAGTRNAAVQARAEGELGTAWAERLSDTTGAPPPIEPYAVISFKRPGVQDRQIRKLRRIRYDEASTLDLHGLTVTQSREAVRRFIGQAGDSGIRSVLISHGKGAGRARPALLKSWVYQWLQEMDGVLAFHSARPQYGGAGATCVLLAKS